jgi:arylsulfatase A-like enzyme
MRKETFMSREKRPNVLLIMTDQQRADCIGVAGNPVLRTPHMDRIANEGVHFSNAFCSNPFCMPSRASFVTGRYPHAHRCWDNGVPLSEDTVTLADHLAKEGYHTLLIGKGHLNVFRKSGSPESWSDWLEPEPRWADWHGPYYGFQEVHMAVGHNRPLGHYGMHLRKHYPEALSCFSPDSALVPPSGAFKSWKSSLPAEAHASTWIADETLEYFKRADENPFLAWISFPDPHLPFCPPAPYCDRYDPQTIPFPIQKAGELEDKPPHFREFIQGKLKSGWGHNVFGEEDFASPDLTQMPETHYREIVAHYYGMISLIDDNLGRILHGLEEQGLADNTVVVFTSDHGELLGDHFLVGKGGFHYDCLIRVPMLWRVPGAFPKGRTVDGLVSMIDIAPTICDLVGAPPMPDAHGRSLLPQLRGDTESARDAILVEFEWRFTRGKPIRTIRTEEWKLTYYAGQTYGELYNLTEDPHEFVNLYDNTEYSAVREQLTRRLLDELVLTQGYLPEQVAPH